MKGMPRAQLAAALDAAVLAPVGAAPVPRAKPESAAEREAREKLAGGLAERLGAARAAKPSRVPELLALLGQPDTRAALEAALIEAFAAHGDAGFVEKALVVLCRTRGIEPDEAVSPLAAMRQDGE